MLGTDSLSCFYIRALSPGIKRIADTGAFLAGSGFISRDYLDATLDDSIEIDTWEQKEFEIFPVQRSIYNNIYPYDYTPDKVYDIIYFFYDDSKKVLSNTFLSWAWTHGRKLMFQQDFVRSENIALYDFLDEIEEIRYKEKYFWSIDVYKSLMERVVELFNTNCFTEVEDLLNRFQSLVMEDITLLKIAVVVSSSLCEVEKMWRYVRQAYSISPDDEELRDLYREIN